MAKDKNGASNVSTDSMQSENVLNQATLGDVADSVNRSLRALTVGHIIGRDGNPVMLPDNGGIKDCSTVSFISPSSSEIVIVGEKQEFRDSQNRPLMIYQINGNAAGDGGPTKPFGVVDIGLCLDTPANRDAIRAAVGSTFAEDKIVSRAWLARNAYFANNANSLRAKGAGGSNAARSAAEAEIVKLKQGDKAVKAGVVTGMLQTMLATAKRLTK